MEEFEALLARERGPVERFVRFRLPAQADADDVLQEVYLTAFQRFGQLKNQDVFRPCRNKCNDYFREMAKRMDLPLDAISESVLSLSRTGPRVNSAVRETLELLGDKDKQRQLGLWGGQLRQRDPPVPQGRHYKVRLCRHRQGQGISS